MAGQYNFDGNGGEFVDRGDPSGVDFAVGDLTADDTFRDLDLSSIVPSRAKAVILKTQMANTAAGQVLSFKTKGNSNSVNTFSCRTQVASVIIDNDGIVALNTITDDRTILYKATNSTWGTINITIKGWLI